MQIQSMHFKQRAGQKLADQRLQQNLKKLSTKFVSGRASAITELDDFEGTRDAAVEACEGFWQRGGISRIVTGSSHLGGGAATFAGLVTVVTAVALRA